MIFIQKNLCNGDLMDYNYLGLTKIKVSRMCFGVLTVGPLQANLPVKEGSAVIRYALENGVNFMDTAQYYKTYPYIRQALKGYQGDVVIASKSYDYTREAMAASVEEARAETGRDVIDIFLMHEQESMLTIKGHWEAYEYLLECKQRGIIKAAGISTHNVAGVRDAALVPEIDVIHAIYNKDGIGINDGTIEDMRFALSNAAAAGKGIYGMKPLGGGNLLGKTEDAFTFVLDNKDLHSIAVGMKTIEEVDMNIALFSGNQVDDVTRAKVKSVPRRLLIDSWCIGCGSCADRCSAGAIRIIDGKAEVDQLICRLCGYCGPVCKEFCIKII